MSKPSARAYFQVHSGNSRCPMQVISSLSRSFICGGPLCFLYPFLYSSFLLNRFQVFVKDLSGNCYSIEVDASELIGEFKVKVEKETGVAIDAQRLIFAGTQIRSF